MSGERPRGGGRPSGRSAGPDPNGDPNGALRLAEELAVEMDRRTRGLLKEGFERDEARRMAVREVLEARRDGTTGGVATFLVLEDAAVSAPSARGPLRTDTEGRALGLLAEGLLDRLAEAPGRPSPRDAALALEVLAARRFAPPTTRDPAGAALAPPPEAGRARGPAAVAPALAAGRYVRAVNFHATPRRLAGRLEARLSWLAERFAPVTYDDLLGLVERGEWPHDRPGVIVSFFDGRRDNASVAAPALERAGLVGWFFVVAGWVAAPPEAQSAFATRHRIALPPDDRRGPPEDGRLALSPDEVATLAGRGHVVASHTLTHAAPSETPPGALEREVAGSRRELERMTGGRPVRVFAWRRGSPLGAYPRADAALKDAGYELLFANHAVQRVR